MSRLGEILEAENNEYGKSTKLVPITLTLVIPKNICGMIIGKGGEALKDLRVKSGAQINMSADCLVLISSKLFFNLKFSQNQMKGHVKSQEITFPSHRL